MEFSRGANLLGMSTKPLDADPYSLFIKKKTLFLILFSWCFGFCDKTYISLYILVVQ